MAVSQNGWPAIASGTDPRLSLTPWVTGRILAGSVCTVLSHVARRFHAEVESITVASSWGWAYRPIAGSADISNHASGTAIDLNAPRHPLGASGTFTAAQVAAIRAILREVSPAVRWGGDYSGRKDEMHFEINTTRANVDRVAARLVPTRTTTRRREGKKMIYRSGGRYAPLVHGIYAHNGGWVELRSAEERTNLMAAGVPEVWILEQSLLNLMQDSRA